MMEKRLLAKLDWYTVILKNRSIDYVLHQLNLGDDCIVDLFSSHVMLCMGYSDYWVIKYQGLSFHISDIYDYFDFDLDDTEQILSHCTELMHYNFPQIRLDISGTGLDFLRSVMKPDTVFFDASFWGIDQVNYHVTRADFAFDFINFDFSFFECFQDFVRQYDLVNHSTRLNLGRQGGVQFRQNIGSDVRCLYLGGTRSDMILRIYDKKLERSRTKFPREDFRLKDLPIQSWLRVELQVRRHGNSRNYVSDCLFGSQGNMLNIISLLKYRFSVRTPDGTCLACFQDLYNTFSAQPISYISDFIQSEDTFTSRLTTSFNRSIPVFYQYLLRYGLKNTLDQISAYIQILNTSDHVSDLRRRNCLLLKLNGLADEFLQSHDVPKMVVANPCNLLPYADKSAIFALPSLNL